MRNFFLLEYVLPVLSFILSSLLSNPLLKLLKYDSLVSESPWAVPAVATTLAWLVAIHQFLLAGTKDKAFLLFLVVEVWLIACYNARIFYESDTLSLCIADAALYVIIHGASYGYVVGEGVNNAEMGYFRDVHTYLRRTGLGLLQLWRISVHFCCAICMVFASMLLGEEPPVFHFPIATAASQRASSPPLYSEINFCQTAPMAGYPQSRTPRTHRGSPESISTA